MTSREKLKKSYEGTIRCAKRQLLFIPKKQYKFKFFMFDFTLIVKDRKMIRQLQDTIKSAQRSLANLDLVLGK